MPYNSDFFAAKLIDGTYDRLYSSSNFAERFEDFIINGVVGDSGTIGDNLLVEVETGEMASSINVGSAYIRGYRFKLIDESWGIHHDNADATHPRIDRVVLELNTNDDAREIAPKIIKGTPASSPIAPALTRNGSVYQLSLAQVLIPANVSSLPSNAVTDERSNSTVCGVAKLRIATSAMTEAGGTMTGALIAKSGTDYTTKQLRNCLIKTTASFNASDLENGEFAILY